MKYTIFTLLCAVLLLSASCRGQEDAPELSKEQIETADRTEAMPTDTEEPQ